MREERTEGTAGSPIKMFENEIEVCSAQGE
jgi:hypothetical protein